MMMLRFGTCRCAVPINVIFDGEDIQYNPNTTWYQYDAYRSDVCLVGEGGSP